MAEKKLSYTAAEIDTLLGEIRKLLQSGYTIEEIASLLGELENLIQLNENGQLAGGEVDIEDTNLPDVEINLD